MRRAKIFAAVIYAVLVMSTMTFVHFPDLVAREMHPKIGADEARATALQAVPGTIKESDLETEHGRLVYSFEIVPSGERGSSFRYEPLKRSPIVEVNVSAMDGSIVNVHGERARKGRVAEQCAESHAESVAHQAVL